MVAPPSAAAWSRSIRAVGGLLKSHMPSSARPARTPATPATASSSNVGRRGEAGDRPLMDDLREATSYYRDEFAETAGRVVDTARRAAAAAGEAFRKAREG